MPNQQLVSYIQQQLKKGYDINAIRDYLLRYGYDPKEVEEAVRTFSPKPEKKKASKVFLIIIAVLIIILSAAAVILFMGKEAKEENAISISNELTTKRIIPGGYIMFVTNIDRAGPGTVTLTHTLIGPEGDVIDTTTVRTAQTKSSTLKLPSKPGKYTVRTTATLGSATDSSSLTITVGEIEGPEVPAEECPADCDDGNICTADHCSEETDYRCVHDTIKPCCGNNICEGGETKDSCPSDCGEVELTPITESPEQIEILTVWEKVDLAKEKAKESIPEAQKICESIEPDEHRNQCYLNIADVTGIIDYCGKINEQKVIDRCYSSVAETTGQKEYCIDISTANRKDNCYMYFVQAGDYTVCGELENKYYKDSCSALSDIAEIEKERGKPFRELLEEEAEGVDIEELQANYSEEPGATYV